MRIRISVLMLTAVLATFIRGQANAPPAPRGPDHRVRLGSENGQKGVWVPPNAGDERLVELDSSMPAAVNPFAIETNPLQRTPRPEGVTSTTAGFPGKLTVSQVPFQPWARAL